MREAIMDRLGGPFDYSQFHTDVREITRELEDISRDFKYTAQVMKPPETSGKSFEKVPPYNFSLPEFDGQSVFKVDTIFGG